MAGGAKPQAVSSIYSAIIIHHSEFILHPSAFILYPAALANSAARWVLSQVNSGSLRPKWQLPASLR
jgi:hypothetical protein